MTNDEIDELWEETLGSADPTRIVGGRELRRNFARVIAAKERAECARVCETAGDPAFGYRDQWNSGWQECAKGCAAAIRARGKVE